MRCGSRLAPGVGTKRCREASHPRAACRAVLEPSGVRGFPRVGLSRHQLTEPRRGVVFREDEGWHGGSEPELAVEGVSTRGDPVRAVRAWREAGSGRGWPGLGRQGLRVEGPGGGHLHGDQGVQGPVPAGGADSGAEPKQNEGAVCTERGGRALKRDSSPGAGARRRDRASAIQEAETCVKQPKTVSDCNQGEGVSCGPTRSRGAQGGWKGHSCGGASWHGETAV